MDSWNFDFDGENAIGYPNQKDLGNFTDILYGGADGKADGDGHGHMIIENATGDAVFNREPNGEITMLDNDRCPGINESKKQDQSFK